MSSAKDLTTLQGQVINFQTFPDTKMYLLKISRLFQTFPEIAKNPLFFQTFQVCINPALGLIFGETNLIKCFDRKLINYL